MWYVHGDRNRKAQRLEPLLNGDRDAYLWLSTRATASRNVDFKVTRADEGGYYGGSG